jgi:hypothetical protein
MKHPVRLSFTAPPRALAYMAGALLPKAPRQPGLEEPAFLAAWRGFTPGDALPPGLREAAAVGAGGWIHPVYQHAATLRLTMALLTHPRFPFPIWRLVQVRNLIVQHRACLRTERLDLEASVVWWRVVPKGMELEVLARTFAQEEPVLESTTTFFTRGDFGTAGAETAPTAPEPPAEVASSWCIRRCGVGRFGRLTGDYNPVHWSGLYARAHGLGSASAHPHRALAQLVDRLPGVELRGPLRIEAWFKGPVGYGHPLDLSFVRRGAETVFALRLQGDARPALVGRLAPLGRIRTGG